MKRCYRHLYAMLLLCIAAPAAFAQVDAEVRRRAEQDAARQQQRQQLQRETEQRQGRQGEPDVRSPPVIDNTFQATGLPEETPCFTFERFALALPPQLPTQQYRLGASELPQDPFRFLLDAMEVYRGLCIGRAGLNLLHERFSALILEHGYSTTRLGIPEQDLSAGMLTMTLVPGIIRAIRFDRDDVYGSWTTAFPARPGDLLNLRALEQGLEQLKRIPSHDVEMTIVPGERSGESDVVIQVLRGKPWKISLSLDDSGAKSTGSLQAGVNLALDNPLGLNDLFNIGLNTDADRQGQQRGTNGNNLSYSLPYGNWTFALSASSYDYHQKIAGLYETFMSSGKGQNLEFKFNRLFQRNQEQKNSVQLKLGKRWNRAYINDTELGVQRRNATYVELAWVHKHYFGAAQLDLALANRWGVSWFNADADFPGRDPDSATKQYSLQTIDASLYAPFHIGSQPLGYTGTLRGQFSRTALFAAEQLSIGNRYTVRGFDGELSLSAERGFFLRNELDLPLGDRRQSLYVGLDVGKVYGPAVQHLLGDTLVGTALGVRGALQGVHYDLFLGWALYKPQQFPSGSPVMGFSLAYQY